MITYFEALKIVLDSVKEVGEEKVFFVDALNRVLAEDIYADEDNPPADNSGMDGYAVRFEDIKDASEEKPVALKVIGESKAGGDDIELKPGTAISIYTGALIPKGADTVIQKEFTKREGDTVYIYKALKIGANIRPKGGDYKKGDLLLTKGKVLRPPEIGILSSVNKATVYVKQKVKVGIITTGDEILDVGEPRTKDSQIRTSNTYTLYTQILESGAIPIIIGFAKDNPEDITQKLNSAKNCDVLLTTGGVSVGEYDLVRDFVQKELNVDILFWKVSQKPGKPVAFGVWGNDKEKLFFGIPGNPVACMVVFETLVKPAIRKMMGYKNYFNPLIDAYLEEKFERKSADRLEFVRVDIEYKDGKFLVKPFEKQGSNILTSMVNSKGLMIVKEGVNLIEKGEVVNVILFDKEFLVGESENLK
ncbi:MAG: molybdopterin molybdotransferase MoeA [Hydrogenothermaceae bacterium]|nr:molybdopterin molybdotransferase MoeA [Hydrogenothermaceae bacterium]